MDVHTYCRLCEGSCGLIAQVEGGRPVSLQADETDPVSEGFICDTARRSLDALSAPGRVTQPLKRVDGRLVPVGWDEAIREIGAQLRAIRGQSGARSVALSLGDAVQRSSAVLVRSLAFALGMGTPNVFSELSEGAGPKLHWAERMIGHAVPLLPDLGRAHYVVLLGADQREGHWGPQNPGMAHERWIQFSRKTKGTKVVVADPRKTALAASMDQHLAIRPGTEPFLLLGMLAATVKGDWRDFQYVRDYTRNYDKLGDLLAAWPVDRCAEICGLPAASLSGVALKFSRAAMAVLHPGPAAFQNAYASVGAWAWLALHTLTANTLRPGALYEHVGFVDPHVLLSSVRMDGGPSTRVSHFPLLTLQAPAAALVEETLTPGEGQVRALLCVNSDPAGRLPGRARVREALAGLDLLVCLAHRQDETTALAHWVLPAPHPWERADQRLHDNNQLPVHGMMATPAIAAAPGEVRPEEDVLRDLFAAVRPGLRGTAWGTHLGIAGQALARADLAAWSDRLLSWVAEDAPARLAEPPYKLFLGDTDRSQWRIGHSDGRIDLLPDAVVPLLSRLEAPPREADRPLALRTSDGGARSPATGPLLVSVHPDAGVADGAAVRVVTRYGEVRATARHDASLRADAADLPAGPGSEALSLLSADALDPLTGASVRDGLNCAVLPA